MAFEKGMLTDSAPAAADLSAKQFTFVVLDSAGKVAANTTAGGRCAGILQNKPLAGETAVFAYGGVSKVVADEALTTDDLVMSSADGQAAVGTGAAAPGNYIMGQVRAPAGAAGSIGSVLLASQGYLHSA